MKLKGLSEAGIIPGSYIHQPSRGRGQDDPEVMGPYTFMPVTDRGVIWYYEHRSPLFHTQNFVKTKPQSNEFHVDDTFEYANVDYYAVEAASEYAERVKAVIPKNRKVEVDLMCKHRGTYYASIKLYPL